MRIFLVLIVVIFSSNAFSSDMILSTDGLRELSKSEAVDLRDALIIANNGNTNYGKCAFEPLVMNPSIKVYVDENSINPLIVAVTDSQWLKITSNESMTQIVLGVVGNYVWKRVNNGTIIKPDFQMVKIITSTEKCL